MAKAKAAAAPANSIWKPLGEEFASATDYKQIADGLGLEIEQVVWSLTEEAKDGVDGHTLSGVAA